MLQQDGAEHITIIVAAEFASQGHCLGELDESSFQVASASPHVFREPLLQPTTPSPGSNTQPSSEERQLDLLPLPLSPLSAEDIRVVKGEVRSNSQKSQRRTWLWLKAAVPDYTDRWENKKHSCRRHAPATKTQAQAEEGLGIAADVMIEENPDSKTEVIGGAVSKAAMILYWGGGDQHCAETDTRAAEASAPSKKTRIQAQRNRLRRWIHPGVSLAPGRRLAERGFSHHTIHKAKVGDAPRCQGGVGGDPLRIWDHRAG